MSIGPPRQPNTPSRHHQPRGAHAQRVARSVQCQAAAAYTSSAGGAGQSSEGAQ